MNQIRMLHAYTLAGSSSPPSSHYLEVSSISISELAVTGVTVLIGILFAALLMIFNIAWRKNKCVLCIHMH